MDVAEPRDEGAGQHGAHADQDANRNEQLQRVVEVVAEAIVAAAALGHQAQRQTHEGAEGRLHHAKKHRGAARGGTAQVESSPTPLDQTFAQATLPAQTTLDPGHPAVIPLVIIAKKVQQAVQGQHPQLDLDRVARLPGLTPRNSAGDHDFAEKTGLLSRERQHIGWGILSAVSGVELAHARVRDQRHDHRTPGRFGARWPAASGPDRAREGGRR